MTEAIQVPAIGYSITANLGAERQVVFQHFVAADATNTQVNADLDRIMLLIDRQRAIYEIPGVQEELDKLSDEISQYTQDKVDTAEASYQRAQAELRIELDTLQGDHKKVHDTAYEQHTRSGRGEAFVPRGQTKQALERIEAGIRQVEEKMQRSTAERDQFNTTIDGNIQRRKDRIALLERKLADLRAKVT